MIKVKRIDHVAIAVPDREPAVQALTEMFGLCLGSSEHVANQRTDVAFLYGSRDQSRDHDGDGDGDGALEIIAPAADQGNPGLVRFLDRRGPGLHHICFEIDDLPGALATLKAAGVKLIDEAPRPGARGHLVAFIHPDSTGGILFELCATPHGAQA